MARIEVPVQLRWSDMDAYAHVNNVEMLRLLEEARIEVFWRHPEGPDGVVPDGARATAVLDAGPGALTSTLVARQEIQYVRPLPYRRAPVVIELWIGHLGGASLDVCYEVRDAPTAVAGSEVYARATTTIVLVDSATGAPRRLTAQERAVWEPYVEEPVVIRRRA
ncbi:acyl-CoA thioesterase [Cellulomonas sp. zg-ZUI22]|uniref:acyl-CoA thioesterase n=1 Tax=Cellulomonas sp. zg-ZUI22 TaxID=2816955 RepID=UPI001A93FFBA|nr:thioesterase family protein [Cellulomonas sp. zg-ZUI22]MBO0900847.1 acyl-CoA thioesterase [Cellulomonas sp. zg-ZUI22]